MTIKLKVGGVYANARGEAQPIVAKREGDDYPFLGLSGYSFMENGQFHNMAPGRNDLIRVVSEPDAPTDAPAPPAVTVRTRVTQVEIFAPETNTLEVGKYSVSIDADGGIFLAEVGECSIHLSPVAARAIGAELIRMAGEGEA